VYNGQGDMVTGATTHGTESLSSPGRFKMQEGVSMLEFALSC
jgi:hypothetical protein